MKHVAVLISSNFVSMNVDGTIHNAKLAADDGIEIFAFGKFSIMLASLIMVGCRITVLYFNVKLPSVQETIF